MDEWAQIGSEQPSERSAGVSTARRLSAQELAEIERLHRQGLSARAIAAQIKRSPSAVAKALRDGEARVRAAALREAQAGLRLAARRRAAAERQRRKRARERMAAPERFYLTVRGAGSWGGGNPYRDYRAGVHEIGPETAEAVRAYKEKHPTPWLVLSEEPPVEEGSRGGLGQGARGRQTARR